MERNPSAQRWTIKSHLKNPQKNLGQRRVLIRESELSIQISDKNFSELKRIRDQAE